MHSTDRQVLDAARRWAAAGQRFFLVTVARTWGSAPRPAGSWMALREDGQVQGSVSGGCVEADLIERALDGRFESSAPFLLEYGVTQEEARSFGLPCGGTMELVIEPRPDSVALEQLSARIGQGQLARRSITVGDAEVAISAGSARDAVSWDGRTLTTVHGAAWRLLIVGAGQISSYLAQMAQALDYQVLVCDPRSEYAEQWRVPGATLLPGMPDDAVIELNLDPHSAVVALTHDPKLDDMRCSKRSSRRPFMSARWARRSTASGAARGCWNISTCRRPRSTACTGRWACRSAAARRRKSRSPFWPR